MKDRGPLRRILGTLGDLLDDGLLNGSNIVKKTAKVAFQATVGFSLDENKARVGKDDLYDLYRRAMSNRRRGEIHGNPEMDRLNMFLAERQMTIEEFEHRFIAGYKKVGR